MKNDMRKVITVDLRDLAQAIQSRILSPHGWHFGWWKVGNDIDPKDLTPRRSLHYSTQSGKRVGGYRFRFRHPRGMINDGHEITFSNLRLAEIESMTLGPLELGKESNEITQIFEFFNHAEAAIPFDRELEKSSEDERTSVRESEIDIKASQSLEVEAKYMSVTATAKVQFEQGYRSRKEDQKRQLSAFRELSNPTYTVPGKAKWTLERTLGNATARQKLTTRGKIDCDIKIWSKDKGPGEMHFDSIDDLLQQAAGLSVKEAPVAKFFSEDGRGLSDEDLSSFRRPIVTLVETDVLPAAVRERRVIRSEALK